VQSALHKHVVSCRGFSKNVACQSWRVGYLISHPETVDAILNFHDPIYISVPILQVIKTLNNKQTKSLMVFISQHALGVFLRDHLDEYVAHIEKSNTLMQANLEKLAKVFT
jgi:histidinol-phosphate/aromatic aminotransferase/cobyric acid decarboxylase-like protein